MSDTVLYALIILGLGVIAGLSIYILKQLSIQREHREKLEQIAQQAAEKTQERRDYLIESVQMISHAVINDDQMTSTEGCMRLHVLLDNLAPHLLKQEPYSVISLIYQQTQHIPIKEQWKSLDRKTQNKLKKEMIQLEKKHQNQIKEAAKLLKDYNFSGN